MEGPLDGLGKGLALLRKKRDLSPEELGRRIGIDASGVRKLEQVGANPQASVLSRHLMHLGAGLRDLASAIEHVTGKEAPPDPQREPTATSMGMALQELPRDAPDSLRRQWALLHDDEQAARVRRHRLVVEYAMGLVPSGKGATDTAARAQAISDEAQRRLAQTTGRSSSSQDSEVSGSVNTGAERDRP